MEKNNILLMLVLILAISCNDNTDQIEAPTAKLTEESTEESTCEDCELIDYTDNNDTPYFLDDNVPAPYESLDPKFTNPNYTGTICGIKRNSGIELNKIMIYEYITNKSDNPIVDWKVTSGDAEIISGENSNILKIRLNEDFKSVEIQAFGITSHQGSNDQLYNLSCSDSVIITKK